LNCTLKSGLPSWTSLG